MGAPGPGPDDALAGMEADKKLRNMAKQFMISDINKRREHMKSLTMSGGSEKISSELRHIMPDYMLVFAVPILAHLPEFTAYDDHEALATVKDALYFVMEPLITKNENFSFNFYKVGD